MDGARDETTWLTESLTRSFVGVQLGHRGSTGAKIEVNIYGVRKGGGGKHGPGHDAAPTPFSLPVLSRLMAKIWILPLVSGQNRTLDALRNIYAGQVMSDVVKFPVASRLPPGPRPEMEYSIRSTYIQHTRHLGLHSGVSRQQLDRAPTLTVGCRSVQMRCDASIFPSPPLGIGGFISWLRSTPTSTTSAADHSSQWICGFAWAGLGQAGLQMSRCRYLSALAPVADIPQRPRCMYCLPSCDKAVPQGLHPKQSEVARWEKKEIKSPLSRPLIG